MQRLLFHPGVAERLMFDLCFGQLLLILSTKATGDQSTAAPSLLMQTIDYIHAHFQQPLSLEGLSEQLHVSKSYLARLFRQHTRMTVTNYINNIKPDYAAQMLRFSSKSIREISEYIGYQDAAYFSRIFRKRFGMSPLKFRLMPKSAFDTPKSKQTE